MSGCKGIPDEGPQLQATRDTLAPGTSKLHPQTEVLFERINGETYGYFADDQNAAHPGDGRLTPGD
jgi:hypothetical protein